jgi:hypothetical protein
MRGAFRYHPLLQEFRPDGALDQRCYGIRKYILQMYTNCLHNTNNSERYSM